MPRRAYPSDVTDEEWLFVSPYLTLMREDAPQHEDDLREVFNGLCWVVRMGAQWRMIPNDLPPWHTVSQQSRRWLKAKVFEAMVHGLRELLRVAGGRNAQPSAAVLDGRTLQSTPESGTRAGYDGYKRKNGSKVHMAVDTLGLLLDLLVTPANEQERRQVKALGKAVQRATDNSVTTAFADQGYTGRQAEGDARKAGMELVVVKSRPKPRRASSSCPDVGWWSAALPRRPAFALWPGTLSAPLKYCAGFISSPLPS